MHKFLTQFFKNEAGSITPIFAVAVMPIMLLSGAAIDYSKQANSIANVSDAADSAMLSIGTEIGDLVSTIEDEAELETEVKSLLDPMLTASLAEREDMSYQIDTVTYDAAASELKVDIEVIQDTSFLQLVSVDNIKSTVSTGITFGDEQIKGALSIAFVMDKSGSMDDDWKHLKNSIKSLKNSFALIDPNKKYIRAGHVLYDNDSKGFFGMDWGMQKSWKEFKKAKYIPKAGQGTNSAGAIVEAYNKLKTNTEKKAHAKKNSSSLRKVVVFFSDGQNNQQADTVTTSNTCTSMKSDGIEIFSIMFGYQNNATATAMMQGCASGTDHYFRTQNKAKLQLAFDAIGETTTEKVLYLSH